MKTVAIQYHLTQLKTTVLEKLAYYCSDFSNGDVEFEGIEYINNPFELGYDEKYICSVTVVILDGDKTFSPYLVTWNT